MQIGPCAINRQRPFTLSRRIHSLYTALLTHVIHTINNSSSIIKEFNKQCMRVKSMVTSQASVAYQCPLAIL